MRSVMSHNFSQVPSVEIPRSTFNRSHGYKTTFDAGYLVPILTDFVYPGDTVKCNLTGFARLSTPIYPTMDNMFMDTQFYAIPVRLIWDNWQKFMGERIDPGDSIDFTIPQLTGTNIANETLWDYLGFPTKVANQLSVSALLTRSYAKVWNEWYRDQNLQDSLTVPTGNGPDAAATYAVLQRRGKRHDYFTSSLPWLQKGDAVQLSLGESAPVTGLAAHTSVYGTGVSGVRETGGNLVNYAGEKVIDGATNDQKMYVEEDTGNAGYPGIYANLSAATASTVNELRQAVQIQRLLEKDARSGTRYIEIIHSHYGVRSPDARLQRPEFLGGGSSPIRLNAIARTDSSPGQLGAVGSATLRGHGFMKSFTEHCVIIGLVSVRADLTYQEGIERIWSTSTRYDHYHPVLAHLGEQAVLNKEIFADGTAADDQVFGYQERWAELRYKNSRITGKFRSNDAASLDPWHLGIEFGSLPTLDDTFIQENPPIDRIIATPAEPHIIWDSYFNYIHTRALPTYSVPGMMDHF